MRSLFFLFALLMAFSGLAVPEAVIARRAVRDPVIDGRLTEPDWKSARWVTLDRSRPARPRTDGEWNELSRMVGEYVNSSSHRMFRLLLFGRNADCISRL